MTLDDGSTTITLPDDLQWVDEFDWEPVQQDLQPTMGGGLVISENTLSAGRKITLVSGDDVWVLKSVINEIDIFRNTVDKQMTLTLPDARTFTVMFDRAKKPMEVKPVWRKTTQEVTDYFTLTLRFLEV